jgi:hypothetical protein
MIQSGEPDMDFTRDSLGKNMGSSRERHEKHMGRTWKRGDVYRVKCIFYS